MRPSWRGLRPDCLRSNGCKLSGGSWTVDTFAARSLPLRLSGAVAWLLPPECLSVTSGHEPRRSWVPTPDPNAAWFDCHSHCSNDCLREAITSSRKPWARSRMRWFTNGSSTCSSDDRTMDRTFSWRWLRWIGVGSWESRSTTLLPKRRRLLLNMFGSASGAAEPTNGRSAPFGQAGTGAEPAAAGSESLWLIAYSEKVTVPAICHSP